MTSNLTPSEVPGGKALRIGLWVAQAATAAIFVAAGLTKLLAPISELSAMMPWAGAVPVWFVRAIALIDLAGGVGLILPALTRVRPELTVLAALGCCVLQIAAGVFHTVRGEVALLPLNVVLLALSVFILWGRGRAAPIVARRHRQGAARSA